MLKPMLATASPVVPEGPEWICQPKFDGWRGLFHKNATGVALYTRSGKAITQVQYITDALARVPDGTILDGEIVDLSGGPQWNRTQSILGSDKPHLLGTRPHTSKAEVPLTYVIFDVLELMGRNLRGETLEDRIKLLHALLAMMPDGDRAFVQPCEELPCTEAALEMIVGEGYEGVVCKRRTSHYYPDSRSAEWLKIKPEAEVEVTITGMFAPDSSSKYVGRAVGGFTFDIADASGSIFKGRCGTGMDDPTREAMLTNPYEFIGRVAELKHWGIAPETGALRFPSLKRIRDVADKEVATPVAPSEPTEARPTTNASNAMLLDKLLDAEEERDEYKQKWQDASARLSGTAKRASAGTRGRNFASMLEPKLRRTIHELRRGEGEGHDKAVDKGLDPEAELRRAEAEAAKKGWVI